MTGRGSAGPAILITIPLSHYCEKARWALDRLGVPYREEPHAPLLHLAATKRHRGGSVPVLLHGDDRFIDSTAILAHADEVSGGGHLYPRDATLRREVEELEERFDTELGTQVRRWAYAHLLTQPQLLRSLWSRGVPPAEAAILTVLAPLTRRLVRRGYRITPEAAVRAVERVRDLCAQVGDRLRDGRSFLGGECFTAADLTFASLVAPMVLPVECRAVQPAVEELPAAMREQVLRTRDTDAGRFALRMFSQERDRVLTT